ncbi:MAG TPA: glycosyltransferase family 2 protein [Chitinophagaceae bacterium]|jgi:glycosyltransferase involved in cell wall biosynthesis|nr:glycosyltransferase family 2 protein [Chitinophagaceae bacterium]
MEKLSVVIITYNEEKNIARCIDSVHSVADEILVLDSYSTDQTAAIAESLGATVKQEVFTGFIQKKNKAVELASNDYVLSLDADEALDPVLADSIRRAKEHFTSPAYRMNRCTNYCGQFIRHGSWYPDAKIRLFNRKIAHWGGINPHDKIVLQENSAVTHLKGDILHYSYHTIAEHTAQNNKLSSVAAESLFDSGKKTNLFKVFVNPCWAFFQSYFLRAGFLDGLFGWVIAVQISHMTFLKHLKLYLLLKSANSR